jgi:AhpD family alkylhydroperoxidase
MKPSGRRESTGGMTDIDTRPCAKGDRFMNVQDQKVNLYKEQVAGLAGTLPGVTEAYHAFTGECFSAGELDERTKQLIALGVALFANNEVCTFYHVQEARSKGASDRQILEAAAVVSAAASGHAMSQGVTRVQAALQSVPAAIPVYQADGAPAGPADGLQDYLQDTEFSTEWSEMSPSY